MIPRSHFASARGSRLFFTCLVAGAAACCVMYFGGIANASASALPRTAAAQQGSGRQASRMSHSRHKRRRHKRVLTRDVKAASTGFERAQMDSQRPTSRSTPRTLRAAVDGEQGREKKFGPARPGKFQRAGSSFEGDLRDLPADAPVKKERPEREDPHMRPSVAPLPAGVLPGSSPQGIEPPSLTDTILAAAPAPTIAFDGLDFAHWGAGHPPDTNGDVGPSYYIQTVNTSIGVYDKETGVRVAAFTFDTFMSQGHFGNLCDTENFGDPVVVYDSFEDRWIITDFAFKLDGSGNVSPQTVYQCIAASKTGDPVAGGWNYYSILAPGGLDDYPKFGIWPDGLYMSANIFGYSATGSFLGFHVWAINKAQMYAGAPTVQYVDFDGGSDDFTVIPVNARLQTGTPPAGSPEYFVSTEQFLNAISMYKLHVDWNRITTSTFTGPSIALAPNCWPDADPADASTPGNLADVLSTRAMVQAQYANISGAESVWLAHTVERGVSANNGTCNAVAGGNATIRWYQTNVTGGNIAANVSQGQSFDPEGANTFFRFLPSLAVDRLGDMAIGYTKANAATNPQMKYAGRLAADPVNTLPQTEQTLIDGTGSQSGNCGGSPCTRWGDYSAMTLDPDGCTFWYTNEYYATSGLNDLTRIGSFKYPSCTTVGNGTVSGSVTAGAGGAISGATVALGSRTAVTDGSGNYSFTVPAGTYLGATASFPGMISAAFGAITVPSGGAVIRNFSLGSAPASSCLQDTTQSDFQTGVPTNADLTTSAGSVILASPTTVDQSYTENNNFGTSFSTTAWGGQTFTAAINGTLLKADLNLFCTSCTGTTPNLTVSIRATSGGLPTGPDLATATITGFSSNSASYFNANFSPHITLSAGTQYALLIRPLADPSAGNYDWVRQMQGNYTGGQRVIGATGGTSWTADPTRDFNFHTYMSAGFSSSGTLVSAVRDANPAPGQVPTWGTLSWTASTPAGTSVKFQVAASNNLYGPYNYVGPDGTASTFFTTTGASLSQFNGNRYLRYQAILGTTDSTVTPTLSDVTLCFQDQTPGASAVAFATSNYTVNEFGGHIDVSVVRTGDTSGPATVNYATLDQAAGAGHAAQTSDYEIALGTLTFAPGETAKTFTVLIVDDTLAEGNETVGLTLSSATGTGVTLGSPNTATLTIVDNDAVGLTTNPYDDPRFFVRQQYLDFLNREPDQSGWDFWTNTVTSCGVDTACTEVHRINVSAAFFLSKEFQNTGYLAYLTHRSAFGPSVAGGSVPVLYTTFMHDVQELGKGYVDLQPGAEQVLEANKVAYFNEFVARPEFLANYPATLTNQQFVDSLLTTATLPTTGAFHASLVTGLNGGTTTRAAALRSVAESSTLQTREFNAGFVTMEYFGYLRRDPDTGGFNFWLQKLKDFNGNFIQAEMVKAFIESTEDRQRFGSN
jgi:hypothetical protein